MPSVERQDERPANALRMAIDPPWMNVRILSTLIEHER